MSSGAPNLRLQTGREARRGSILYLPIFHSLKISEVTPLWTLGTINKDHLLAVLATHLLAVVTVIWVEMAQQLLRLRPHIERYVTSWCAHWNKQVWEIKLIINNWIDIYINLLIIMESEYYMNIENTMYVKNCMSRNLEINDWQKVYRIFQKLDWCVLIE